MVTGILFLFLFIKVGAAEVSTGTILNLVNVLLLANLLLGFLPAGRTVLFNGMFHTDKLIVLEKNILNLGTDRKSVV